MNEASGRGRAHLVLGQTFVPPTCILAFPHANILNFSWAVGIPPYGWKWERKKLLAHPNTSQESSPPTAVLWCSERGTSPQFYVCVCNEINGGLWWIRFHDQIYNRERTCPQARRQSGVRQLRLPKRCTRASILFRRHRVRVPKSLLWEPCVIVKPPRLALVRIDMTRLCPIRWGSFLSISRRFARLGFICSNDSLMLQCGPVGICAQVVHQRLYLGNVDEIGTIGMLVVWL